MSSYSSLSVCLIYISTIFSLISQIDYCSLSISSSSFVIRFCFVSFSASSCADREASSTLIFWRLASSSSFATIAFFAFSCNYLIWVSLSLRYSWFFVRSFFSSETSRECFSEASLSYFSYLSFDSSICSFKEFIACASESSSSLLGLWFLLRPRFTVSSVISSAFDAASCYSLMISLLRVYSWDRSYSFSDSDSRRSADSLDISCALASSVLASSIEDFCS